MVRLIGKSEGRAPNYELYPGICLTIEEKARKNLSICLKVVFGIKFKFAASLVGISNSFAMIFLCWSMCKVIILTFDSCLNFDCKDLLGQALICLQFI